MCTLIQFTTRRSILFVTDVQVFFFFDYSFILSRNSPFKLHLDPLSPHRDRKFVQGPRIIPTYSPIIQISRFLSGFTRTPDIFLCCKKSILGEKKKGCSKTINTTNISNYKLFFSPTFVRTHASGYVSKNFGHDLSGHLTTEI